MNYLDLNDDALLEIYQHLNYDDIYHLSLTNQLLNKLSHEIPRSKKIRSKLSNTLINRLIENAMCCRGTVLTLYLGDSRLEITYRGKIKNNNQFDLELWEPKYKNYKLGIITKTKLKNIIKNYFRSTPQPRYMTSCKHQ